MINKKVSHRKPWIFQGIGLGILVIGICLLFYLYGDERFVHVMNGDDYASTEDFAKHFSMDVEKAIRYTKLAEKLETDGELNLGVEIAEIQVSENVFTSLTLQDAVRYGESLGLYFDENHNLVTDNGNIRWDVNLPPEANMANMLGDKAPEEYTDKEKNREITEEPPFLKESTEEEFLANVGADAYDPETGEFIRYPSTSREEREAEELEENKLLLKLLYQLAEYYELHKYFGADEPVGNFAYRFVYVNDQEKVIVASNRMDAGSVNDIIDLGYYFWINSERDSLTYSLYTDAVSRAYTAVKQAGLLSGETYEIVAGVNMDFPYKDIYANGWTAYQQFRFITYMAWCVIILGISVMLASFGYLVYNGRKCSSELDRWYTEAVVLVLVVSAFFLVWSAIGIRAGFYDEDPTLLCTGLFFGCLMYYSLVAGICSMIRRWLTGEIFGRSLIIWVAREMIGSYQSVLQGRSDIFRTIIFYLVGNTIFVSALALTLERFLVSGVLGLYRFIMIVVSVIVLVVINGAAFIYAARRAGHGRRITEALIKISDGVIDTRINTSGMRGQDKEMADTINSIGDGLIKAVEEQTRSERMKTDLIANVSHDLRTPLTSIINYVDLLKREKIDNPRAKEYLDILESKSQRMKHLTEDLMEASKVSSGNMTVNWTRIDLVQMVNQMEGEFQEKFEASELVLVKELVAPPLYILADGRLLFRVLENIYNNVCKYAMKGTRVYIDLKETSHKAVFTMKNISADPLNISADELTGRFVRGDVSRSTEGSGLGLSIAQSITELLKGTFEIYLEGDLFRVRLVFPLDEEDRS